jgi:hypothetical protein
MMCCVAPFAHAGDDLESLDADFLSYLAEFEGEDDDWTIVEPPSSAKPVAPAVTTIPSPRASEQAMEPPASKAASETGSEQ